jgi:hypothetical protein
MKVKSTSFVMWILIDVIESLGIESTGTPDDAMDFIAFEQK